MKKSLKFLLKLLLSFLFTFFLIELGLRLFPGLVPLDLLVYFDEAPRGQIALDLGLPTKEWHTRLLQRDDGGPELRIFNPFTPFEWEIEETGTIKTTVMDEIGFCNPPKSYQASHLDIITLGDSFTACHAVTLQETWTSQLALLTGRSTYNLGKIGIGAHEYLQIFKKFGLAKSPNLVIMNVYGGNDFRDAAVYYNYLLGASEREAQAKTESMVLTNPLASGYQFLTQELLQRHSYAFNLGQAAVQYNLDPFPETEIEEIDEPNEEEEEEINFRYQLVFPGDVIVPFNPENTDTDEVDYAQRLFDEEIEPGVFLAITEALTEFVELSRQHHFVPVVTYMPSVHVSYATTVVFEDPHLATLMPWYSREQRKYLERKSREVGFIFIDLTPALQAAAQASDPQHLLYYQGDLHLTPAGHLAVAKALDQALRDLELISRSNN